MSALVYVSPGDEQDLSMDYDAADFLADDETIESSDWVIPAPLDTYGSADINEAGTVTTVYLKGFVHGQEYIVTNTVTTSIDRKCERSFKIVCRQQ